MNLVLLGAPGSGKGTQARMLSEYYKLKKISLGDILRDEANKQTTLGEAIKKYMKEGVLVPDNIIKELISKQINKSGFILDGFPRSLSQAEILREILGEKLIILDKVIYFKVLQDTAVNRLTGRRICRNCGALYHTVTMPSDVEGVCEKCGRALIVREDDKEDTVRKRWEVFMKETHGLIDYYSKESKLLQVNGDQDKDKVFQDLKGKLDSFVKNKESTVR